MKRTLSFVVILMLMVSLIPGVYATESNEVNSNVILDTTKLINPEKVLNITEEDLNITSLDNLSKLTVNEIKQEDTELQNGQAQTQGVWIFNDPFGIVNGNLTDIADYYLVENPSDAIAFIKLTAEDPNLIALLFYINSDGTLGDSTGFGVYANQGPKAATLPIGTYVIVIGSMGGTARGTYQLHWNRSNPSPQANERLKGLKISEDLMHIVLYYRDDKILSNGNNLMANLEYEGRRDFYVPNGYAYISTSIFNVMRTGDIYTGAFSYEDFIPYSTNNALIANVNEFLSQSLIKF